MIDNPNHRNFYSEQEMIDRQAYVHKMKEDLLKKIKDLKFKIDMEEPFPHRKISIDDLCDFGDKIDDILNNWYY